MEGTGEQSGTQGKSHSIILGHGPCATDDPRGLSLGGRGTRDTWPQMEAGKPQGSEGCCPAGVESPGEGQWGVSREGAVAGARLPSPAPSQPLLGFSWPWPIAFFARFLKPCKNHLGLTTTRFQSWFNCELVVPHGKVVPPCPHLHRGSPWGIKKRNK